MGRRRAANSPAEKKTIPRWLIIGGAIVAPLLAYIGARGGPTNAFQETAEAVGFVKAPHIVTVQPRIANKRRFLVSIENPSLRSIQITGYRAEPSVQLAAALSVTKAEEDKPEPCEYPRKVSLRNPLVIASKSEEGLEVEPWLDECDFSLRVEGTTGLSNEGYWIPKTTTFLKSVLASDPATYRELLDNADPPLVKHLKKSGLVDPKTISPRPRSSAPPPPPPPPAQ